MGEFVKTCELLTHQASSWADMIACRVTGTFGIWQRCHPSVEIGFENTATMTLQNAQRFADGQKVLAFWIRLHVKHRDENALDKCTKNTALKPL